MTHVAVFVLGPPGAGKTRFATHFLKHHAKLEIIDKPKWTIAGDVCAAGWYTGSTFDGADTVGYNQAAESLVYWRDRLIQDTDITLFDGDRFSSENSLRFVRENAAVLGLYFDITPDKLAERRALRGSNQNEAWMRGRATKARNFADKLRPDLVTARDNDDLDVLTGFVLGTCETLRKSGR